MPKIKTPHKKYHKLKSSALVLVGCLVIAGCIPLAIGGGQPTNLFNLRQQQDNQPASQPDPATASLASKQAPTPAPPSQADPNHNIARNDLRVTVFYYPDDNRFRAIDYHPRLSSWKYVLVTNNTCNSTTNFNNSTSYTESSFLTITEATHGARICFRLTAVATGEMAWGISDPIKTVLVSRVDHSFTATDTYTSPTTWAYVLITNTICDSTTNFSGSTSYTEDSLLTIAGVTNNGARICFRSTDSAGNHGYGASVIIDITPPTVTVSRGSVDNTFRANDNDSTSTTWIYFLTTNNSCGPGTNNSGSTSYTEGSLLTIAEVTNGERQICFRSTDFAGNDGFGIYYLNTVLVSRVDNSFTATDTYTSPTTWVYVLIDNTICDSTTNFSGSTSYTEGSLLTITEPTHGERICFRSTDSSGDHTYDRSHYFRTMIVSRGSVDNSFTATDTYTSPTTWVYVLTTNNSCGSGTNFNNSTSYIEGSLLTTTEATHGARICFRSTDSSGNHGYGISSVIDVDTTPPTVTVSRGSVDDTFKAVDNDNGTTTWAYVLITNTTCNSTTSFSGSTSYTEGDDVVPTEADNTKRLCFRSTDSSGNHGYGSSTTINVDQTAPVVTVSQGSVDDSFQANDNDNGTTSWAYVLVTNNSCGSGTNFNNSSSYTEGDDVVPTEADNTKQLCFRSTDSSNNHGYGSSTTINVDQTAPVVTVSRGSADGTFQANDNDNGTTSWAYVLVTNNSCGSGTNFNNSSSYTEGDDVVPTEADNTKRLCFRSTDSSGNHGYGRSTTINVDQTAPVVTVSRGSADGTFQANDNDNGTTSWAYVLITNNTCNSTTSFSGSTSYTEGDDVVPTEADNTKRLCFRSTDSSNNAGYGSSTTINVDQTAPVVTVSRGSADGTFQANDNDNGTTSWAYVLITNNTCNSTTNFSGSTSYTEGDDVVPTEADNTKRLCFRSTDSSNNAGYGSSTTINVDQTAPVVTVSRGSADGTFQANDNDNGTTSWAYVLITNNTCNSTTSFSGSTSYTEGDDVVPTEADNTKRLCFRSTDSSNNAGYGSSTTINVDQTAPVVTVSRGSADGTFQANDNDNGTTSWAYVLITNNTCNSTTSFSGSTSYTEGDDVVPTEADNTKRLCFRSTDSSNNAGYGSSTTINVDQTAPVVTVSRGSADGTFQANDNDNGTTSWAYVLVTNNSCGSGTNFNNSSSYTEGDDVVPTEADNTKQLCFRSTDSSGNHGYGRSTTINVDQTAPVVTVSQGSVDDSFQANDNDNGTTSWAYVLITNNTCNSTTSFSGSTSYTEGDDVVPTEADNTKRLCFRSTDSSNNAGYGSSTTINVDQTAPVVTVSRGSADGTFQANDNDNGTTSWAYVLITNNTCNSTTNFSGSTSYTEGDDVVPTEADNTKRLCFRSTDSSNNAGYGSSTTINVDQTAPVVTVSRGSADGTFQANDNDNGTTSWAYVLITNNTCNSTTSFSGSTSYTEGDDVVPTEADNTKRLCFRSTDSSNNAGYGSSTTINVDQTAPVVTVSRGSADGTFQANDNDNGTTSWAYVLVTNNSCGSGTNFNNSSSYTEGDDVVPTEADNTKQLCFRSTDSSGNHGYGRSTTINVDQTAPVVTVSRGSADGTFQANDNDNGPTSWAYVLITNNTCNSTTSFSGSTSYTEGDDVVPTEADNTKRLCFRSTDSSNNAGYGSSTTINVDQTAPVVTVSRGSADGTFQANDNDNGTTSWAYVLITNNTCNSTTNFSGSTSYTEGDDVVPTEADNTKRLCFRSTDSSNNAGYGSSTTINVDQTAPVVTVSRGSADGTFQANDNDNGTTSWAYVLITNNTCNSTTNFSGSTSYTEGDDVVPTEADNTKRLCFRSTDSSNNAGYGSSTTINVDQTAPVVTVSRGSADGTFQANDNDNGTTSWAYVLITNNTCNSTTSFSGSTSYTEGDDVVPTEADNTKRLCFRSTDSSNNAGYGSSTTINVDQTAPVVTVSRGSADGTFQANDNDNGTTSWAYVLVTNNSCGSGTNFNNSSSYTEGDDVVPTEADNTKQLCFRSTDSSGNHGYGRSTTINVDQTAPVVTVSQGSVDDSFQANDNDNGTTSWAYVLITNNTCNSTTSFSGSTSYTEGDDVVPTEADNTKRLCFRSTDSSNNAGYGSSTTINVDQTAPVVTVSRGSADGTFQANDNDNGTTSWAYVLITNNTCNSTTNFSGSTSYTEGDDVVPTEADNTKRLCFRSTDSSNNAGYGSSTTINVDQTAPVVTVSRGSADGTFQANDNDNGTTSWAYVLITNNTCNSTTNFSGSTSYTEGDDVVPTEADNTKRLCFRSTDSSNNAGYGSSTTINVDQTAPVVTVSRGSADGTFQANDNDNGPTSWAYVLITNNTCNSTTNFSGSTSYTEGDDVVPTEADNTKRLCFRSTDSSNNAGYGSSTTINVDQTAPVVTVSRGSADGTFQANDNDNGPTSWAYVLITNNTCNSTTNFSGSTSYTEGDDVVPTEADNTKRLCFRSTDSSNNAGYGSSTTINVDQTAPVVTVSRGSADGTFQANDNDNGTTSWAYVLITNNTCNSTTNFSGSTSYTEGDDVVPTEADNTKRLCFRSTDSSNNAGYGSSTTINVDQTAPVVTVSRGSADGTFQANDNDNGPTSWAYVLITNNTCNSTTNFSGSTSYTEGDDVVPTEADNTKRLCFRSTDSSNNAGYGSSTTINVDQTAPVVTVSRGSADGTFQANDNDNGTTSWAYVLITNNTCNSTTNFSGSTSYTEGDDVVPTEADNTKRLCFRSTDSSNNAGYGSSTTINVDQTAPVVTVSRGSADGTFQANDNDNGTTSWAYVLITNNTCNSTTNFSGSTSYTEGDDVVPTEADNTKRLCFRSTDSSNNAGYGSSTTINVDQTAPVVTVSRGSADGTFQANDNDNGPTSWAYVLITNNTCNSTTNFSGSTSYTEGDDVVPTEADNTKRLCFRSTDSSNNAGYGSSTTINVDQTAPVVTVSRGSADGTFQANDNDNGPTSWAYVLITNNTCNSTTNFSGSTSYTEGDDVVPTEADNTKRLCFRSTDSSNNAGYGSSTTINVDQTAPVVTVSRGSADGTFQANDNDNGTTSWAYVLITNNTCNSTTSFSGSTSYTEGDDVVPTEADNTKRLCFRSTDSSNNAGYGSSTTINVDQTAPVVTVSRGSAANQVTATATATDDVDQQVDFEYQFISSSTACDDSLTTGFTSYSGAILSLLYDQKACFRATDDADNAAYKASEPGVDISPPQIILDQTIANQVSATTSDTDSSIASFDYQIMAATDNCDDSLTSGFTSYNGAVLSLLNNQKACFRAVDSAPAANTSYQDSQVGVDPTPAVITVSEVVDNQVSATATDPQTTIASFKQQLIDPQQICGASLTNLTAYSSGSVLTLDYQQRACFEATNGAGQTSYASSTKGQDQTAPVISVEPLTSNDKVKATVTDDVDTQPEFEYQFVSSSTACDDSLTTGFSSYSSQDLQLAAAQRACFKATDSAGNSSYKSSDAAPISTTVTSLPNTGSSSPASLIYGALAALVAVGLPASMIYGLLAVLVAVAVIVGIAKARRRL